MKSSIIPLDLDTGEIASGIHMSDEADRRRSKAYWERQNAATIRRENHATLGEFCLASCRESQFEGLQPQDIARLVYLASYMDFNGALKNEGKALSIEELPALLGVSKKTFDRLWSKVEGRYIVESEDGTLTVVDVFFRGRQRRIKERLTKIFIQKLRALYEKTAKSKCRYLGYIFQLIYQVSVEFNVLCENPLETNLDRVQPITVKEFARKIGYDESQTVRLEKELSRIIFPHEGKPQHFCAFVSRGGNANNRFLVINPRIFYAGSHYEQVDVLGLFFK